MTLQIIWFVLWGVLWAVYFMLDGFVLGTGMLAPLLSKSDGDRRMLLHAVGPLWNGNEVWLITAGGATFAAFPTTYALMFSYLYTAMLLLLFALIIRGVAIEFRDKATSPRGKTLCDRAMTGSCFLIALLFGVAFGNIFRGLPMDQAGFHGSFWGLLNPYGLITGVLFLLLFALHGSLWVAMRTTGELSERARLLAIRLWSWLVGVTGLFLITTKGATRLFDNYVNWPVLFLLPALAVFSLGAIRIYAGRRAQGTAFIASCLTILLVTFTGIAGLFPRLIPSLFGAAHDLTIFNSSSSSYTLTIMTVIAAIFVPIVIAYQLWVYRLFAHPLTKDEVLSHEEGY